MKVDQSQHFYNDEQHILQNSEQIENNIYIDMDIALQSDALIDFQKDIFSEYFGFLVDQIKQAKKPEQKEIKKIFEHTLQELNSKLAIFANKMAKVDYFPIKGCIKVLHNNILMASLVGNVSIMIFREKKLFYAVNNEYKATGKIDFFSEFVEGEIQTTDEIILVGNNIYTVFDKREIKRFNEVFVAQDEDICEFLEEIISMRIDKKEIGLIINAVYDVSLKNNTNKKAEGQKTSIPQTNIKNFVQKNKFLVSVSFLALLIVILIRNILKGSSVVSYPIYVDEYGNQNEITPEKIKKDIAYFQKLDPSSDEKSHMYRTIIEQLDYIESQGYRPEDIDNRRRIIEKYYNKGFNIVYETSLKNFDDELNGTRAQIIAFNDTELTSIGEPKSLVVNSSTNVGGSEGSIIGLVNNDIRGSLVTHTEEDETILGCSSNILRDGLYCYNENGNIYNISKAGSTIVTTESPGGFPGQILGLDIFGKTNLYVLNKVSYLNQEGIYISRYRNSIGSQTQFGPATDYQLPILSGSSYPEISNMAIDGSFLVRSATEKALLQRRREGTTLNLNSRKVPILGGDKSQETRGENIKILTNSNTRYILVFDKDNHSLTVYDSQGLKTNDANATNFSLQYIMKFKLDLENENIVDMTINENDSNQLNLYILTDKGVYKIKLFEFIQEIKNNESKSAQQSNQ